MYSAIDAAVARHGVPVGAALREGLLTFEDFLAFLAACRRCEVKAGRASGPAVAASAPADCANRAVIEGLRGLV